MQIPFRRRSVRWFQFRLRTWLAAVLIVGSFSAQGILVSKHWTIVAELERRGAIVESDFEAKLGLYPAKRRGWWPLLEWTIAKPVAVSTPFVRTADFSSVMQGVVSLPTMQSLNLSGMAVTAEDVAQLAAFPALERLHLAACSMDDVALDRLSVLPNLKVLDLSESRVSNASIQRLASFPALTEIYLTKTQVTAAGAQALRQAKPGLQVYHDRSRTPGGRKRRSALRPVEFSA